MANERQGKKAPGGFKESVNMSQLILKRKQRQTLKS